MSDYLVIDSNSEVVDEIHEGDRILRKKSIDYLVGSEEINSNAAFVKLYLLSADALSRIKEMKATEYQVCLRLLQYIRYDSGVVAYDNGRVMGVESIKRACSDMGGRTVERALSSLVERGVLSRAKQSRTICFVVNPYIFMRGMRVNKTLKDLFHNSAWAKLYEREG